MPSRIQVVTTVPPSLKDRARNAQAISTEAAMEDLFGRAKRSLNVLVSYVDPSITGLVHRTEAHVQILSRTLPGRGGPRTNPVLDLTLAQAPGKAARVADSRR